MYVLVLCCVISDAACTAFRVRAKYIANQHAFEINTRFMFFFSLLLSPFPLYPLRHWFYCCSRMRFGRNTSATPFHICTDDLVATAAASMDSPQHAIYVCRANCVRFPSHIDTKHFCTIQMNCTRNTLENRTYIQKCVNHVRRNDRIHTQKNIVCGLQIETMRAFFEHIIVSYIPGI